MKLLKMTPKEKHLTRGEYAVALAFESLYAMTGECPTQVQIADLAKVSQYTVSTAMARLVKLGYYGRAEGRNLSWFVKKPVPRKKATGTTTAA